MTEMGNIFAQTGRCLYRLKANNKFELVMELVHDSESVRH